MIVPMDTVECEKAGSGSLLAARTHPFDDDTKQRVYRVAAETTGPSEQNFGITSGERSSMHGDSGWLERRAQNLGMAESKSTWFRIIHQCAFRKIAAIRPQRVSRG